MSKVGRDTHVAGRIASSVEKWRRRTPPTIRSCRHQLSPIARDRKPRSTGPADFRVQPNRLTNERTFLVSSPAFVFERIDLPPNSAWCLGADRETWLLVLSGGARTGSFDVTIGDAVFVQSRRRKARASRPAARSRKRPNTRLGLKQTAYNNPKGPDLPVR